MADEAEASGASFDKANELIRGTAKWFIAAAAGVGAALIAGSQLSSIGKLDMCVPTAGRCARLPSAVVGAVVALVAVGYLMWHAVQVLLPVGIPIDELEECWDQCPPRADVAFFKAHPAQMGYPRPADLIAARVAAWSDLQNARAALENATAGNRAAREAVVTQREAAFEVLHQWMGDVTTVAQHIILMDRFRRLMRRVLGATAAIGVGIIVFAWAANPPESSPGTADLSGADLTGADLRDADLSGADLSKAILTEADLRGASLDGASLKDVVWRATTCPDGTNSTTHEETCLGHLTP